MSRELYLKTSLKISGLLTRSYSTSFSLGIKMFPKEDQEAITSIYGLVRVADEIVDTFHEQNREKQLEDFKRETDRALEEGFSTNPIIYAFVMTAKKYHIDREYVDAFFESMAMDLTRTTFSREEFDRYVYGSAEVIGLMCLRVYCYRDQEIFGELIEPARKLGSALQKVNFLRDIKNDLEVRKRIYLSGIALKESIDANAKTTMEREIETEFNQALVGVRNLPNHVRLGVYSVYLYYQDLFRTIQKAGIQELLSSRLRISGLRKLVLLSRAFLAHKLNRVNA